MSKHTCGQERVVEWMLGRLVQNASSLFLLPEELCLLLLFRHLLTERTRPLECAMAGLLAPVVEAVVRGCCRSRRLRVETSVVMQQIVLLGA